jgi:pimeloyl-ACP methyl ester carboxylesterase
VSIDRTRSSDVYGTASTDEPVFFPKDDNTYCGIISMPTSDSMSTTGVVLLAGTGFGTGTIGRNRMWVRMARMLADAGTPTLRFDYAGIGDSSGEMIGYDLDTPAVDALRAAFDLLSSRGIEKILVVGTCFGARTALAGSVNDPRVAGIHLIVPPVGSNKKGAGGIEHLAEHAGSAELAKKAVAPRTLKRLVRSKDARRAAMRFASIKARRFVGAASNTGSRAPDVSPGAASGFGLPLKRLLAAGVPIHILFGMDDFYWTEFKEAAQGRLGEDLDRYEGLVEIQTIPGVLRGFPSVRVQDLAVGSVVDWVSAQVDDGQGRTPEPMEPRTRVDAPEGLSEEITYFGESPRLYGVTHVPHGDARASVVICSSTHAELLKSYRLEVLLARALAHRGFAVHRFHYGGAGHSEADDAVLTLPTMVDASRQAMERIVDISGTDELVFVGVRLGAYPATVMAAESGGTPLILWDPVLDTDRFMKDALRSHAIAAIKGETKPETIKESLARLDTEGSIDLLGYKMRSQFHSSIRGRKLSDYSPDNSNVLIVPFGRLDQEPLRQTWGSRGIQMSTIGAADRAAWWLVEDISKDRQQRGEDLASRTADWVAAAIS